MIKKNFKLGMSLLTCATKALKQERPAGLPPDAAAQDLKPSEYLVTSKSNPPHW